MQVSRALIQQPLYWMASVRSLDQSMAALEKSMSIKLFSSETFPVFIALAEELAEEFSRQKIEYVVGDSEEGYSPTHDACRLLTDAAVEIVRRRHKREIANFDFAVVGPPDQCPADIRQ